MLCCAHSLWCFCFTIYSDLSCGLPLLYETCICYRLKREQLAVCATGVLEWLFKVNKILWFCSVVWIWGTHWWSAFTAKLLREVPQWFSCGGSEGQRVTAWSIPNVNQKTAEHADCIETPNLLWNRIIESYTIEVTLCMPHLNRQLLTVYLSQ